MRFLGHSLPVTLVFLLASFLPVNAATLPTGFIETQITGLTRPTQMEIAPDGRIFVCLQQGQLRVVKNGVLLPTPFVTLDVNSAGERGLLGITFDPDFANNNYVYVYYTVAQAPIHNRISRFTADGDVAEAGSEVVILELETLDATVHNGGAIHFGADGKLYIATGDNGYYQNAQSINNHLGKMLRINSDGTIPTDNPYYDTAILDNKSIWAIGLRNPFTFAFQPGTGRMFINDVGQDSWEEINDGIAGSNYGWPELEGPSDHPAFRGPIFSYAHGFGPTTGCAISGGTFYNPTTVQFPAEFVDKYFFTDLCTGWIRVLDPATNTASPFASGIENPVDLKVGDDGSLYYLSIEVASLFKVQYAPEAPTIAVEPADQTVLAGQPANFSVSVNGSAPFIYQWQRNQVDIAGATSSSYSIPATAPADTGVKFRCLVTNPFGDTTSNEATLTVNTPPSITANPANKTVMEGASASFDVTATGSTPLSYQWQRNQVDIAGATSSSYAIPVTSFSDNGAKFRCRVSNAFGSANSNEATLTVNAPPSVTANPTNKTVMEGASASFEVVATGSTPLGYQWQRNQVDIAGATSASYSLPTTAMADNGAKFRCRISNAFGTVNSNEATLTVNAPPSVTAQPANKTAVEGASASFDVTATGSTPLGYQWQRNQVDIAGATSASYSLPTTALADNGAKFRCRISNAFGTVNSNEATLTVNAPPSVTAQPANKTVLEGASASFDVTATGSTPLGYQWQRNQVDIAGATSSSYSTPVTSFTDNGAKFRCRVSNTFGTATSNEATLTVNAAPSLTAQPQNLTVAEGQSATFTVTATGSPPLSYQWQRNQVDIAGATSSSYAIPVAVFADHSAKFRCRVSNAFGAATSNEATLTVNAPPRVTSQPANQDVLVGEPASFTVAATGSTPLTYQWQRNQTDIAGATSPSYAIAATALADNGAKFRCIVTNAFGAATSNEATLGVTLPAPEILTEAGGDAAIMLGSVTMVRDPFRLSTPFNFSADQRTRLMLFVLNGELLPGETSAAVTVRAEDAQSVAYPLSIEFLGPVEGFDFLTQIVVRLPNNLPTNADYWATITLRGKTSNRAHFRMQ